MKEKGPIEKKGIAWNIFKGLGTGLDRPDFQLDMGVKASQELGRQSSRRIGLLD